ncbi:helix-turn-helix domain-containing protein [Tumebacillus permanentifrigoris]|uniref:DNA-binding XRE family transcriptional regulator n=1 Tax=Tumebacillus permanentifrigoris TaxID=378543 RepID=A0A316D508_9BACL|nr:helix-turn-helix domain-containing protein [Tumebacillus permanentifrigoris]PWK07407.1 DNA-binding XRE family transcriptional regulator [Tumebacillus permanentifrigoris]
MNLPLHTKETLGERVKRFRTEREMSQAYLAEICKVTDGWISKIENDKYAPSPEMITKMASAFKIPVYELLQEEDKRMELVSRIRLIEALLERNQPEEAELFVKELMDHPDLTEKDRISLAVHLSECRYQQARYDEALSILQPLVERLENANYHDAHMLAWLRNKLGSNFFKKNDFTSAYYNYQKAFDLTPRFETFDFLAAKISYNVGMTLRRKGMFKTSIPFFERAIGLFKDRQDLWQLGQCLLEQGLSYKAGKNYDLASQAFESAKSVFQMMNLKKWIVEVQISYATAITALNDPLRALQELKEAETYFDEIADYAGLTYTTVKMARVYLSTENFVECWNVLIAVNELIVMHDLIETPEAADFYSVKASYHNSQGEHQQSIDAALISSSIFGKMDLIRDQIDSLKIAVDSYHELGNLENAFKLERQRNELLESISQEVSIL